MSTAYCPQCRKYQNMNSSSFNGREKDLKEQRYRITTTNYQCSVCHSFVKSEETKERLKE